MSTAVYSLYFLGGLCVLWRIRQAVRNRIWWWRYRRYLRSPQWREKAERCKAMAGYRCRLCGGYGGQLQAHHRTYARVFEERDEDLMCVHYECHRTMHPGKEF